MKIEQTPVRPETAATLDRLREINSPIIETAINFTQKYLGEHARKLPFPTEKTHFDHSVEVAGIISPLYQDDPEVIAMALLHDVIEDVPDENIYDEIKDEFGERVARGVAGLSEDKRLGYFGRKMEYSNAFVDPARRADELVVISAADKYVNVRDMNKTYEALVAKTGDIRLATALHYGAFYGSPHEARQFYHHHAQVVGKRLDGDDRFTELVSRYETELATWDNIFTPPETYQREIAVDDSTRVRRLCWKLCYGLNQQLKTQGQDVAVAIAGSAAYGAVVRISEGIKSLNNINLVFYNPMTLRPISKPATEADLMLSGEPFSDIFSQMRDQVTQYCTKNTISINNTDELLRVHADFYATL